MPQEVLERAMGIELHTKFLSLTETRCYQPLRESIVAKCCQGRFLCPYSCPTTPVTESYPTLTRYLPSTSASDSPSRTIFARQAPASIPTPSALSNSQTDRARIRNQPTVSASPLGRATQSD